MVRPIVVAIVVANVVNARRQRRARVRRASAGRRWASIGSAYAHVGGAGQHGWRARRRRHSRASAGGRLACTTSRGGPTWRGCGARTAGHASGASQLALEVGVFAAASALAGRISPGAARRQPDRAQHRGPVLHGAARTEFGCRRARGTGRRAGDRGGGAAGGMGGPVSWRSMAAICAAALFLRVPGRLLRSLHGRSRSVLARGRHAAPGLRRLPTIRWIPGRGHRRVARSRRHKDADVV